MPLTNFFQLRGSRSNTHFSGSSKLVNLKGLLLSRQARSRVGWLLAILFDSPFLINKFIYPLSFYFAKGLRQDVLIHGQL